MKFWFELPETDQFWWSKKKKLSKTKLVFVTKMPLSSYSNNCYQMDFQWLKSMVSISIMLFQWLKSMVSISIMLCK